MKDMSEKMLQFVLLLQRFKRDSLIWIISTQPELHVTTFLVIKNEKRGQKIIEPKSEFNGQGESKQMICVCH